MQTDDIIDELFEMAEEHFIKNEYEQAEPVLNQLVLKSVRRPEVFHMLGTIYYDQGKFKKAIRSFQRSLEIDPSFTDSSVGLSIILNDLGKYSEGQKVFDEARAILDLKSQTNNQSLDERFAGKHAELGDMYFQHGRYEEALREFSRALGMTAKRKNDLRLQIADCHINMQQLSVAVSELKDLIRHAPDNTAALLRLGKVYYDLQQVPEAISQWELALKYEPENKTARDYLRLTQSIQVTNLYEPPVSL